jgi:rhodanese-related sulfurtransferase
MNKTYIDRSAIADGPLLQQAVDKGVLIICDMRPAAAVIAAPVKNALFMQIGREYVDLLRFLLSREPGDLLLISGGDYLSTDREWLAEVSERNVYVFDCGQSVIPDGCLEATAMQTINAEALADLSAEAGPLQLLDLRTADRYDILHITGSQHLPLNACWEYISILDRDEPFYVYGNDDAEAVCFVRLLQFWGYHHLLIVSGGFPALERNDRFYMNGNS